MKRTVLIAFIFVLLINSASLGLQYLYIHYLCEDEVEFLEIAGKKIRVCGKVCSIAENDASEKKPPIVTYKTDSPFLFLSIAGNHSTLLTGTEVVHLTTYSNLYDIVLVDQDLKPPSFII